MPDYRIVRNGLLLGTLTRSGSEPPWWLGQFDPAPGFETVRPLIERQRRPAAADSDWDYWGAAWDELRAGLVLEPLDGRSPITEFLLDIDIDDGQAAWRY